MILISYIFIELKAMKLRANMVAEMGLPPNP